MITIKSEKSEAMAGGTGWFVVCEACGQVSDTWSRPSRSVAWALEHQRRCRKVSGAPVTWTRDGVDMGLVTPMLVLDTTADPALYR